MSRKVADCTTAPSEVGCGLVMIGEEDELMRAAIDHLEKVHSHADTPEIREWLRTNLADEATWLAAHNPTPA